MISRPDFDGVVGGGPDQTRPAVTSSGGDSGRQVAARYTAAATELDYSDHIIKRVAERVVVRQLTQTGRPLEALTAKVSVGAGPPNPIHHVDFNHPNSQYEEGRQLAEDLVPIINEDLEDLVAHGADFIPIEDFGAWMFALADGAARV